MRRQGCRESSHPRPPRHLVPIKTHSTWPIAQTVCRLSGTNPTCLGEEKNAELSQWSSTTFWNMHPRATPPPQALRLHRPDLNANVQRECDYFINLRTGSGAINTRLSASDRVRYSFRFVFSSIPFRGKKSRVFKTIEVKHITLKGRL